MSMQERFSFEAQTLLPGLSFPAIRSVIQQRAQEFDLPVVIDSDDEVQIETTYGNYSLQRRDEYSVARIGAPRADWLYVLKESLSDTLEHLAPEIAAEICWSDAQESAGRRPPNFQFITVEHVARIPGSFLRVTAQAEDLTHFTTDAIHFRLALPNPALDTPQWPYLSETGQTIWPKGDATLHRPVYTVRALDVTTGRLVFDIFEHDGGRATEWARSVSPGCRVGLTGPGGGGIPEVETIMIYADETGFPAVARILDALGPKASGRVVLELTAPESADYLMPHHPGIRIEHHGSNAGDLGDLAIATLANTPGHMVWLAAEKSAAQKVRAHLKSAGLNAKDHYIAAYWTRQAESDAQP
ncbi:siderophore-interacting protein [Tritonibacter scottomollicae]|uniref:siderophore-interacting protein n=1 Tax=Tritonibacter scottomollicae TaxID=483013 RepID=UPI003AA9A08C